MVSTIRTYSLVLRTTLSYRLTRQLLAGYPPLLLIAGILLGTGCRKISLAQHRKEATTNRRYHAGIGFFPTTKAHLDSIWGPKQTYYYWGSDQDYHYITTQHITVALLTYHYQIPVSTKIENPLTQPVFSRENQHPKVLFKKTSTKQKN